MSTHTNMTADDGSIQQLSAKIFKLYRVVFFTCFIHDLDARSFLAVSPA